MATETTQDPATEIPVLGDLPKFRTPPDRTRTADTPTRTLPPDTPTMPQEATDPTWEGENLQDDNLSPRPPPPSSSRAFTPDPAAVENVQQLVEAIVGVPALIVNRRRARGTAIWLLDDQDREAIAGPLARIAARHTPAIDGDAGDVIDGLTAMVGVGGYVIKNLEADAVARAFRGGATLEAPGGQPTQEV